MHLSKIDVRVLEDIRGGLDMGFKTVPRCPPWNCRTCEGLFPGMVKSVAMCPCDLANSPSHSTTHAQLSRIITMVLRQAD